MKKGKDKREFSQLLKHNDKIMLKSSKNYDKVKEQISKTKLKNKGRVKTIKKNVKKNNYCPFINIYAEFHEIIRNMLEKIRNNDKNKWLRTLIVSYG